MRTIFTDLDNTIIFSHRHYIGDKVCVEYLNGKAQSFMTTEGYWKLQNFPPERIIPVTSRTKEQYDRLHLYSNGEKPVYALIDNGGILLIDGKVDQDWLDDTYRKIGGKQQEKISSFIRRHSGQTKLQDGMIIKMNIKESSRSDGHPNEIFKLLEDAVNEGFLIFRSGRKFYACPRCLTKGNAIDRFLQLYPCGETVCAGDSIADLSMIQATDFGIFSDGLKHSVSGNANIVFTKSTEIAEKLFSR